METRRFIATSLFAAFTSAAAHAGGEVIYYRADERPDPATVARILAGTPAEVGEAPVMRTRSIRTRSIQLIETGPREEQPAPLAAAPRPGDTGYSAYKQPQPDGLALPVQFAFDSAEIRPDAVFQLDAVAEGIKLAGRGVRVVIEGHTDAQGSDDYNRRLSLERASSVKAYLVHHHGIDPARLSVEGRGEAAPVDPFNPFAAQNRRVEFRAARG